LPAASCGLPAGLGGPPSNACAGRRAPCGVRRPSWPCSGWGLPSRPSHLGRWWSLTPPFHPYRPVAEATTGGLLSVALSRGSPRVGVTHHPALWSPDFPRRSGFPDRRGRPAGSSAVIVSLRERPPTCDCPNRASCRGAAHNAQSMDRHPQEIWRASRSMDTRPAPRPRLDGVAVHCSAGCADPSWVTVH